jgi:hypothetical protein
MGDGDMVRTLQAVRQVLLPGGRVVITCPDDARGPQVVGEYASGIALGHARPIPRAHLEGLIRAAGLVTVLYQELDYTDFVGHGLVCEVQCAV